MHGTGIFTYMRMVDVYGKWVGKHTSPMDAMGPGCLRAPEV